jgi:dTDP-4-dehydrorhamnose reductase
MQEIQASPLQIWAGIECTINRVHQAYFDQLSYSGHYARCEEDIAAIASLGIRTLRYPILWEHHQPEQDGKISWDFAHKAMSTMQRCHINPIVGLVHHGSGPAWVSFYDGSFEQGLCDYALQVARQFPWVEYYTPVNEPVTTARFCGLYGFWYPHKNATEDFCRILISECKATVLAMQAIRSVNPAARLVQTEDLGKTYSTPVLHYQAVHENRRRWLGFELLCGRITPEHHGWNYFVNAGIKESELLFFLEHPTPPDIMGFNYYATSERYIDEDMQRYPVHTHGGNGIHTYADVEAVRVHIEEETGLAPLLREAWEQYRLPMAITEAHLHCTREHQTRWLHRIWQTCRRLREEEGLDLLAVTAWAALGAFGWNTLLRVPKGDYEPGIFDTRSGKPRPTAIAKMIRILDATADCAHPVLEGPGWWEADTRRLLYHPPRHVGRQLHRPRLSSRPLLILGKTGTLGRAFARICAERDIDYVLWGRQEMDIAAPYRVLREKIAALHPWAVVNATGYVRVEDAEDESRLCFQINYISAVMLAHVCAGLNIPLLSFSSDLVFDGEKGTPYTEHDAVRPLNVYGRSKATAEQGILQHYPGSLIVRSSAFFSPWDQYNFIFAVLKQLSEGKVFIAAEDVIVTPTYVPDLVHECLNLLQDEAHGIWHITNGDPVSWAAFAGCAANRAGLDESMIEALPAEAMNRKAKQPRNSALQSVHGIALPTLEDALHRYFEEQEVLRGEMKLVRF